MTLAIPSRGQKMNSTQASLFNNSTDGSAVPVWWETFDLVNTGALGILMVLAEVGNILTIAAIVKYRHLRKGHYMLIASLAVADALVGLAWGIFMVNVFHPLWRFIALDHMLITLPTTASHLHVLLMAIDRSIAIKFPFRYTTLMSERGVKICVGIVWMTAFVYALAFLPWALRTTPNRSSAVYVVFTQFGIYLLIACSIFIIYNHINRVAKLQVMKVNVVNSTTETRNPTHTIQDNPASQDLKMPVTPKATRFMIAVMLAYLVTWTPFL